MLFGCSADSQGDSALTCVARAARSICEHAGCFCDCVHGHKDSRVMQVSIRLSRDKARSRFLGAPVDTPLAPQRSRQMDEY
jgi:hypothetical protein